MQPRHCAPGDEVWVRSKSGPVRATVRAAGTHGITGEIAGKHHKIKHADILGHHTRAPLDMQVEEEGEDGVVLRDAHGKRHWVAIPAEAREGERMVVKSLGGARMVTLHKYNNTTGTK